MVTRIILICCCIGVAGCADGLLKRPSVWVDVPHGEPVSFGQLCRDLSSVDIVYLGERHTIQRHHDIQNTIIETVVRTGRPIVVGFEMLEKRDQIDLDGYCSGELDFETFAEIINWGQQWNNYSQYKAIFETARKNHAMLLGLNAPREVIRQIGRGGIESLDAASREQLPLRMNFEDEAYKKRLSRAMQVMSPGSSERLNMMVQAQIARDETMAQTLTDYLQLHAGQNILAIVICGSGHVNYGMGTARRISDRMPELKSRIVVMSASGDVVINRPDTDESVFRGGSFTEQQPIADYLYITSLKPEKHCFTCHGKEKNEITK